MDRRPSRLDLVDSKVVLKLELRDDKDKQKAMKTVSSLSGVESVAMDMKDKKLTVVGEVDPVRVAAKLRKLCHTEIVTVGPSKEPEKKKDEPKKEDQKKKDEPKKDDVAELVKAYQAYYNHHPPMPTYHYYRSQEGYPYYYRGQEEENGCVIC